MADPTHPVPHPHATGRPAALPAPATGTDLLGITQPEPPAPPGPPPIPGVPGYDILGILGKGGMGVVYKARQQGLNRLVALKMIRAGGHAGDSERSRFRAEAEAVAALQHPNIVQIFEVGEHEGLPFFSLEFCPGGSLAGKLDGTPWQPRDAARLAETLARAMHAAHQRGIVHRDLKPQNVLLAEDGTAKVSDFGLAKRLGVEGETVAGMILGTPSYMAPEQADGQGYAVGPAADVYALGAILYQLLTGRAPFQAPTPLEVVQQVIHQEPVPPRRLQPQTPRDLETVCLKCLSKEPARRYADADALADDLARYLRGEPVRARPVGALSRSWRWCRRNPVVAALAAGVVLALVAGTAVSVVFALHAGAKAEEARRGQREASIQAASLALDRGQSLCVQDDPRRGLLWIARALELAPADAPELEHAVRANLAAWRPHLAPLRGALAHGHVVTSAAFSPEGATALTGCADGTARLWDAATGRPLASLDGHGDEVSVVAYRPDGKTLLTAGWDGTARHWDAATGHPLGEPIRHGGRLLATSYSPDGKRILTAGDDNSARLWDAGTGKPVGAPLTHQGWVVRAVFSPDGKRILTGSLDQTARVWDAATGKPLSPPLPQRTPVGPVCFSPDGKLAVTGGAVQTQELSRDHTMSFQFNKGATGWEARIWDAETGALRASLAHGGYLTALAFSPDGRILVTGSSDGKVQRWAPGTGEALAGALTHAGPVLALAFSPDGRVLLAGSGDGEARLWDVLQGRAFGGAMPHPYPVRAVAFRPDGRAALTGCGDWDGRAGEARLWEAPPRSPSGLPFALPPGTEPLAITPDGRFALLSTRDEHARFWDLAGGQAVGELLPHSHPRQEPIFSPSGRSVLVPVDDRTVRLFEAPTGKPLSPPLSHPEDLLALAFQPDGQSFVTASEDGSVLAWDATGGRALGSFLPGRKPGPLEGIWIAPDGQTVLTREPNGGAARLWSADGIHRDGTLLLAETPLGEAVFSADGKRVLLEGPNGEVWAWDTASGKAVGKPLRHGGAIQTAAFSPDRQTVVTAGADGAARLWRVETGEPFGLAMDHRGRLPAVGFSPDGRFVVTVGEDRVCRLWDAVTGRPVGGPLPVSVDSQNGLLLFDALGGRLLTTWRGVLWAWDYPVAPTESVAAVSGWARLATGLALDAQGAVRLMRAGELEDGPDRAVTLDRPPPEGGRAWHLRETLDAELRDQWLAARWHLDRLVDREPAHGATRFHRARAGLALGDWGGAVADATAAAEHGADDWQTFLLRARAELRRGRAAEAPADCDRAAKLAPREGAPWLVRSLAQLRLGRRADADADFSRALERSRAIRLDPARSLTEQDRGGIRQPNRFLLRNWLFKHQDEEDSGQLEPAPQAWAEAGLDHAAALEGDPKEGRFWRGRGLAYAALGNYKDAAADFDRAAELDTADALASRCAARAHFELKEWDKVAAACTRALAAVPDDGELLFLRGSARVHLKQGKEAEAELGRAAEHGFAGLETWLALARARKEQGHGEQAVAACDRAVEVAPQSAAARLLRGTIRYERAEYDAALLDLTEAIRLDPDLSAAHGNRGLVYRQKRDFDLALKDLDEAIRLDPRNASAYNNRGWTYQTRGDQERAIRDFTEAILLAPREALYHRNRGLSYRQTGNLDAAIRDYTEAIRLSPEYATAFNDRGVAWFKKGDHERALADYTEAVRLAPRDAAGHSNRGFVLGELGRWADAEAAFARAVELAPGDVSNWHNQALTQLAQNKLADYRDLCKRLVRREGARTAAAAVAVARVCALGPSGTEEAGAAVALARKAADGAPKNGRYRQALGAALYRAGEREEAAQRLREAADLLPGGSPELWLFLALAEYRLGHGVEARKLLDRAAKAIDREGKPPEGEEATTPGWGVRLQRKLLLAETEATPEGPP